MLRNKDFFANKFEKFSQNTILKKRTSELAESLGLHSKTAP